jgi:hypothetical protein
MEPTATVAVRIIADGRAVEGAAVVAVKLEDGGRPPVDDLRGEDLLERAKEDVPGVKAPPPSELYFLLICPLLVSPSCPTTTKRSLAGFFTHQVGQLADWLSVRLSSPRYQGNQSSRSGLMSATTGRFLCRVALEW